MNQAYFHTSYTPTQFANHSSRTTPVNRDPEIRRRGEKPEQSGGSSSRGVRRDDGLPVPQPVPLPAGRLSPLSSNIQLPPTHLRRRHPTDFTFELISRLGERQVGLRSSDDLIDQLHLDMGRIYATLRSSHGLASYRRASLSAPSWPSLSAPRHRLSLNAEEYSMVVILRMNRAFIGVHAQAREGL